MFKGETMESFMWVEGGLHKLIKECLTDSSEILKFMRCSGMELQISETRGKTADLRTFVIKKWRRMRRSRRKKRSEQTNVVRNNSWGKVWNGTKMVSVKIVIIRLRSIFYWTTSRDDGLSTSWQKLRQPCNAKGKQSNGDHYDRVYKQSRSANLWSVLNDHICKHHLKRAQQFYKQQLINLLLIMLFVKAIWQLIGFKTPNLVKQMWNLLVQQFMARRCKIVKWDMENMGYKFYQYMKG